MRIHQLTHTIFDEQEQKANLVHIVFDGGRESFLARLSIQMVGGLRLFFLTNL